MKITIDVSVDELKELLAKSDDTQIRPVSKPSKFRNVHSRLFTRDYSYLCTGNARTNLRILEALEQKANEILKEQGCITLNEVYRILGLSITIDGYELGWNTMVDGERIDFGIWTLRNLDFLNGASPNALLTFKPYKIK